MTEPPRPRAPYGAVAPVPKPAYYQAPWERADAASVDRSPLERLRHCYVLSDESGWLPALLLEWRGDGAEARVVRPVLDFEDGKWRPREEWLPAANVRT